MMDVFIENPEPLLATIARLFVTEGKAREVAILANSKARIEQTDYDNWDGGTYGYTLYLQVPTFIYTQIRDDCEKIEGAILDKAEPILRMFPNQYLRLVKIIPEIKADEDWREKARAWVKGEGVSNQGRVRSNNIASRTCDGLLFRSEPEINLYKALKALGVSFAPLPVFIRGGNEYRRIEPDFVIVKDGVIMVIEVDGDTVHQETPAEAHARTTMLAHEGVFIERVLASECGSHESAKGCAAKLLQILSKHKASK